MHKITKILNKQNLKELNQKYNNKYYIQNNHYPLNCDDCFSVEYPVYYMENNFYIYQDTDDTPISDFICFPLYKNIEERDKMKLEDEEFLRKAYPYEVIENMDRYHDSLEKSLLLNWDTTYVEKVAITKESPILYNSIPRARYF